MMKNEFYGATNTEVGEDEEVRCQKPIDGQSGFVGSTTKVQTHICPENCTQRRQVLKLLLKYECWVLCKTLYDIWLGRTTRVGKLYGRCAFHLGKAQH